MVGMGVAYLDNHTIDCGPGRALQGWQLQTGGCSSIGMQFRYRCAELASAPPMVLDTQYVASRWRANGEGGGEVESERLAQCHTQLPLKWCGKFDRTCAAADVDLASSLVSPMVLDTLQKKAYYAYDLEKDADVLTSGTCGDLLDRAKCDSLAAHSYEQPAGAKSTICSTADCAPQGCYLYTKYGGGVWYNSDKSGECTTVKKCLCGRHAAAARADYFYGDAKQAEEISFNAPIRLKSFDLNRLLYPDGYQLCQRYNDGTETCMGQEAKVASSAFTEQKVRVTVTDADGVEIPQEVDLSGTSWDGSMTPPRRLWKTVELGANGCGMLVSKITVDCPEGATCSKQGEDHGLQWAATNFCFGKNAATPGQEVAVLRAAEAGRDRLSSTDRPRALAAEALQAGGDLEAETAPQETVQGWRIKGRPSLLITNKTEYIPAMPEFETDTDGTVTLTRMGYLTNGQDRPNNRKSELLYLNLCLNRFVTTDFCFVDEHDFSVDVTETSLSFFDLDHKTEKSGPEAIQFKCPGGTFTLYGKDDKALKVSDNAKKVPAPFGREQTAQGQEINIYQCPGNELVTIWSRRDQLSDDTPSSTAPDDLTADMENSMFTVSFVDVSCVEITFANLPVAYLTKETQLRSSEKFSTAAYGLGTGPCIGEGNKGRTYILGGSPPPPPSPRPPPSSPSTVDLDTPQYTHGSDITSMVPISGGVTCDPGNQSMTLEYSFPPLDRIQFNNFVELKETALSSVDDASALLEAARCCPEPDDADPEFCVKKPGCEGWPVVPVVDERCDETYTACGQNVSVLWEGTMATLVVVDGPQIQCEAPGSNCAWAGIREGFCPDSVIMHSNRDASNPCVDPRWGEIVGHECEFECKEGYIAIGRHVCQWRNADWLANTCDMCAQYEVTMLGGETVSATAAELTEWMRLDDNPKGVDKNVTAKCTECKPEAGEGAMPKHGCCDLEQEDPNDPELRDHGFFGGRCARLCQGLESPLAQQHCAAGESTRRFKWTDEEGLCLATMCFVSPTANLKNQARGVYEAFADARNATTGFYLDNINVPSGQDSHVDSNWQHGKNQSREGMEKHAITVSLDVTAAGIMIETIAAALEFVPTCTALARVTQTIASLNDIPIPHSDQLWGSFRRDANGFFSHFANMGSATVSMMSSGIIVGATQFVKNYFLSLPTSYVDKGCDADDPDCTAGAGDEVNCGSGSPLVEKLVIQVDMLFEDVQFPNMLCDQRTGFTSKVGTGLPMAKDAYSNQCVIPERPYLTKFPNVGDFPHNETFHDVFNINEECRSKHLAAGGELEAGDTASEMIPPPPPPYPPDWAEDGSYPPDQGGGGAGVVFQDGGDGGSGQGDAGGAGNGHMLSNASSGGVIKPFINEAFCVNLEPEGAAVEAVGEVNILPCAIGADGQQQHWERDGLLLRYKINRDYCLSLNYEGVIVLASCQSGDDPAQDWVLEEAGDPADADYAGAWNIKYFTHINFCLTVNRTKVENGPLEGANLNLETCDGSTSQMWLLQPASVQGATHLVTRLVADEAGSRARKSVPDVPPRPEEATGGGKKAFGGIEVCLKGTFEFNEMHLAAYFAFMQSCAGQQYGDCMCPLDEIPTCKAGDHHPVQAMWLRWQKHRLHPDHHFGDVSGLLNGWGAYVPQLMYYITSTFSTDKFYLQVLENTRLADVKYFTSGFYAGKRGRYGTTEGPVANFCDGFQKEYAALYMPNTRAELTPGYREGLYRWRDSDQAVIAHCYAYSAASVFGYMPVSSFVEGHAMQLLEDGETIIAVPQNEYRAGNGKCVVAGSLPPPRPHPPKASTRPKSSCRRHLLSRPRFVGHLLSRATCRRGHLPSPPSPRYALPWRQSLYDPTLFHQGMIHITLIDIATAFWGLASLWLEPGFFQKRAHASPARLPRPCPRPTLLQGCSDY